ncbi:MAG: hypothetical protein K0R25_240 [Rickettsiaceae bacterium]|jgi:hypothetical protein|nr:hypothetical protein [Rickettsiaceae bacterium]
MKKLSFITLLGALFLSSQVSAKDGLYVGADLITSDAQFKYSSAFSSPFAQKKVDSMNIGVGANIGYKKSFNRVFVAPELFYDYLNSSTKDYYHNHYPYTKDTLELPVRYGAKANFGFNFTDNFAGYLTYGLSNIHQIDKSPALNANHGRWKISPIYGAGSVFNINPNWGIKIEFNRQKFEVPYSFDLATTSKVKLNILKTGLVYNF